MFSVVIPLYNKEISLGNAIKSVLAQTYFDFELLIVNDGSTDSSVSKVESYKDPRIRLINKLNGGVSSARNRGISEAKYEYIAFIDADDFWEPDFLETIERLIKAYPQAGAYTTAYSCFFNGVARHTFGADKYGIIDDFFQQVYKSPVMHASSVCIKKSTFNKIGLFDLRITHGEDYNMWSRLARQSTIAASPESKVKYNLDTENRAMSLSPQPSKLWLYYIDSNSINDKGEKLYYKRFIRRQTLDYFMKGKFKWGIELTKKQKSLVGWHTYLFFYQYIQRRQITSLMHAIKTKIFNK